MWKSMTSYGAAELTGEQVRLSVEIKTVNGRHLDAVLRFPRELAALEGPATAEIKKSFSRGRVEVGVRRTQIGASALAGGIDAEVARGWKLRLEALGQALGVPSEVPMATLLTLPGVVTHGEGRVDAELEWPLLQGAITQALVAAEKMRRAEGEVLREDIRARLELVSELRGRMAELAPQETEIQWARLSERVGALLRREQAVADRDRLLQEVAIQADRADISEELTRLGSHLAQCRELLEDGQPVGRRLDFLLQELFREANTITSKANLFEIKKMAVEVKTELEKIREQAQNVE